MSSKKKEKIKSDLKSSIISVFESSPSQLYNYKQIAKSLGEVGAKNKKFFSGLLYTLAAEGVLIEAYKGKFKLSPAHIEKQKRIGPFVTGRVDMKQTGKAYVITDDLLDDIRISSNNTGYALHDDLVRVRLFPRRKGKKIEGEIIEVLERSKTRFVGIVEVKNNYCFLLADNKSMPYDIFIPREHMHGVSSGEKAVAEIIEWAHPSKNPFGKIIEVLGTPGENDVEMHAILAEYGLPSKFESAVENEASKISDIISEKDLPGRRDFRNITTFTIDPYDAKDFDDALSVSVVSEDTWEIGVHIADVTHYVLTDSLIEKEARQRATSIYLVDRTIPMLPEKLSNHICSLRPYEDKLCYTVVFTISSKARILKTWIGKSVIRSDHRFNYDEVQDIIESGSGKFYDEINILNNFAKTFRKRRMQAGAIDFDRQEVKFKLDADGKPLEVFFRDQKEANKLIEEFMLLANKAVAEKIGRPRSKQRPKTFVYRVHDIPNPEKLNTLSNFVEKLGYKIKTDTRKSIASSFNRLLKDTQGKGEENMIETLTIRTMAKAEYSTENIGHYGLAFDYYTHFTSPIRRYPDMMVHRLLHAYEQGATSANQEYYEELSKHSTKMEILSQAAERDSIKYKQVEFLADKIGEEFDGLISGVSKWGIFVEIKDNKCEGMIRMRDLDDDYYYLDEENFRVIGYNNKREFKLGSPVRIRISRADLFKKELDFVLV